MGLFSVRGLVHCRSHDACSLQMLMANGHLSKLSVTCNKFGEAGGKLLQEGMEDNKKLVHFDLRLTDISQESEYCINQIIKNNFDASKTGSKKH